MNLTLTQSVSQTLRPKQEISQRQTQFRTCPECGETLEVAHCGNAPIDVYQCWNCGKMLDPVILMNKRCTICGKLNEIEIHIEEQKPVTYHTCKRCRGKIRVIRLVEDLS